MKKRVFNRHNKIVSKTFVLAVTIYQATMRLPKRHITAFFGIHKFTGGVMIRRARYGLLRFCGRFRRILNFRMSFLVSVLKNKWVQRRDRDILARALGRYENSGNRCIAMLSCLLVAGGIWYFSGILNSEGVRRMMHDHQIRRIIIGITQRYGIISRSKSHSEVPANQDQSERIPEARERDSACNLEENTPRDLREILSRHYKGSSLVCQERAFKRVLRWKEDFEDIVRNYSRVDWKRLSAIIKAETQGKTGEQVSSAKAIGMPQIRYQGAWAFVWDALFSEKSKQGPIFVKDYHNANIRARYSRQLKHISDYLEENDILVYPANSSEDAYRKARAESWKKLRIHLRTEFNPGEYQVAVDIAAMYMDHLTGTFSKIKRQVEEIKQYVEYHGIVRLDDVEFSGTRMTRWKRIKGYVEKDMGFTGNANVHELTLARLKDILDRLEDPDICLAAYNLGISRVLEYTESGRDLPEPIEKYIKKVSTYTIIFNKIEKLNVSV